MQIIGKIVLLALFAQLSLSSCKKSKDSPEEAYERELVAKAEYNNSVTPGAGNLFIEENLLPGQPAQVFAKLAFRGDSILFIGSTNNQAKANGLHTIAIDKGNNEYVVTEYLTSSTTILYRIRNGVKSRLVIKTRIFTENEKQVIFLDYDWKTNTSKVLLSSYFVDDRVMDTKSIKASNSVLVDGKICGDPPPSGSDEMDNYLNQQLQFIACHGTHPINQPIIDLKDKLKTVPDFDQFSADLSALTESNDFFESAFNSVKDAITNYKFEKTKAGRFYEWLQKLVQEYLEDSIDDVQLTLSPAESDLVFNEGIDEYLKVTLSLTDPETGAAYTKGSGLAEIRLGNAGEVALYGETLQTSMIDGKVTFFINPEDISNLGTRASLEGFYGFKGLKSFGKFNVSFVWRVPNLRIASGNNQVGKSGQKLADPLRVRVLDQFGKPFLNYPVSWRVISGNGFITYEERTDAQGYAKADWTIGTSGTQEVEASAKKKDGSMAEGAPLKFSASTMAPPLLKGYYEVNYSWGDRLLLEVNDTRSSGKIMYYDSSKGSWYYPSFQGTFTAYYSQETDANQNPVQHILVYINTGGCLSEGFKLSSFDSTRQSLSGSYTIARCYHDDKKGTTVSVKYIGLSL